MPRIRNHHRRITGTIPWRRTDIRKPSLQTALPRKYVTSWRIIIQRPLNHAFTRWSTLLLIKCGKRTSTSRRYYITLYDTFDFLCTIMGKRKISDSIQWQKPLHKQKCKRAKWQHKQRHKKSTTEAVADRLRTVSWSNYGHPTGVVNLV